MQLKRKVTICLLGFVFCLFSIIGIATINYGTNNIAEAETNGDDGQKICTIGEIPIYFDSEQVHFNSKEINASFTLQDSTDVVSIDFENNGIDVLSYELISGNKIFLYMNYDYSADEHSLSMSVILSNGETLTSQLFAIDNDSGVFISPFSLNDAYENYFIYAKSSGILSQEDCETIRNNLNSNSVIEESAVLGSNVNYKFSNVDNSSDSMPKQEEYVNPSYSVLGTSTLAAKDTYVKGTLRWTDDSGVTHPLRRVMVRIYDKEPIGQSHIGTVYSDNQGNFSFTFQNKDGFWDFENGGLDIFVRVYAGDTNALVKIGSGSDDYYYQSTVSENMATGTTKLCNYTFGMGSDLGRAFQISQALLTARDYAWNMMGQMPNSVTLRYPYDTGCYYNSGSSRITITGNAKTGATVPESYASWDVIMHEYGHHIEYQMGIIDSPGGSHTFTRNLADERGNKSEGIRLAWSEAWATVFGMVGQNYWSSYLTNIATVNDSNYDAYNFYNAYSVENVTTRLGEACEGSVMAVLWDLFDSGSETNDLISLGTHGFWNATTQNQNKTFSDFIKEFYNRYPQHISNIGANLTRYQMATTVPVMSNATSVSQTNPPRFTWTPQGGSTTYPNNKFRIVFYDSNGSIAFKTAYTTSSAYTLTQSEWDSVLHTYGSTYTVAVAAMQTDDYSTGEYISASTASYTKPTPTNLTASISLSASSRYTERIVDLQPNQYIDYTLNFSVDGNQVIQTFGTKDTKLYLYDSNGTQLAYNDDSGYSLNALINYSFKQNVTYTLRVKFYSSSEAGKIRVAIIPQKSSYSSYESFFQGAENWSAHSGSLANCTSSILRYNSSTAKSVTFTTDCEFDAYLYVIDPRSTDAISSSGASVYNDDGAGNLQATITKQLDANVPYLVILTAYNPSTQSGDYTIKFSY